MAQSPFNIFGQTSQLFQQAVLRDMRFLQGGREKKEERIKTLEVWRMCVGSASIIWYSPASMTICASKNPMAGKRKKRGDFKQRLRALAE
jgi:hypothetical protein